MFVVYTYVRFASLYVYRDGLTRRAQLIVVDTRRRMLRYELSHYICQAGLVEFPGRTAERRRKPRDQIADKPRYYDRRKTMMDISN